MGSTFAGLNTSYTGLVAARSAIEVAGQNTANANTVGYTRQRVAQSSIGAVGKSGMMAQPLPTSGGGVSVDKIARLGNNFADQRVRTATASNGFHGIRAEGLSQLEKSMSEPTDSALAAQLTKFWNTWQDLGNNPGNEAAAGVVIEQAHAVADVIATGYIAVDQQWGMARATVQTTVDELNTLGKQVAELNEQIRMQSAAGGSTNELVDLRNVVAEQIATVAGGTVNGREDGLIDVLVGGNPLVTGSDFNPVKVIGGTTIGSDVHLEWEKHPGLTIAMDGGELAAHLSLLAPANASGSGGALSEAAATYNAIAQTLAATVNAVHQTGVSNTGATGLDFFGFTSGTPFALGLAVIPTQVSEVAVATPGAGALDGSVADKISQLGKGSTSVDTLWKTFVTTVGVTTQSEVQQFTLSNVAFNNAQLSQQSMAGVDLDEEQMNLLQAQTAYQAAARAFTAVDEMLDTLINKTGVVGR